MKHFEKFLVWIAFNLTDSRFLLFTKIQGILWSIADIALVYFFLKIADSARIRYGELPIRKRYLLLWISAALTPLLVFATSLKQIFILESVVCGIQYAILIVTVIGERRRILKLYKE